MNRNGQMLDAGHWMTLRGDRCWMLVANYQMIFRIVRYYASVTSLWPRSHSSSIQQPVSNTIESHQETISNNSSR